MRGEVTDLSVEIADEGLAGKIIERFKSSFFKIS